MSAALKISTLSWLADWSRYDPWRDVAAVAAWKPVVCLEINAAAGDLYWNRSGLYVLGCRVYGRFHIDTGTQ